MNKVMKALAALMLMTAVVITAGCNKKPDNPDNPEETIALTGMWYANDQWFENEHDRAAMDFVNSNTVIWYGTVSTNKNAFQNMEGTSLDGCAGWYYFSKTYYTYVLTDNKLFFNDRIFTIFENNLIEDGSSWQWVPWNNGNGGGGDTPETITVTTYNPTDITSTEAICCADVTAENGSNIRELGICWGTSAYPTVENSHLSTTTWNKPFVCTISDLVPETKYHVRAYALNGTSYVYGDDKTFTTLSEGGGGAQTYTITATANPTNGGMVIGSGTYQEGQQCTLIATANSGYDFVNWTENETLCSMDESYTFIVNGDRDLVAVFTEESHAPEGAINGKFTINSNDDKVYFSQGNLQYKASADKWRFAQNQFDYIGEDNSYISSSYNNWIDLFGWGTSGWNCGNIYYRPWDSNTSNASQYGPPGQYNLTGSYANSDWGYYNKIGFGGNTIHQWRTLTHEEWEYVFNTRNTTSGIRYAKAQVNNVNGIILVPDDWNVSTYSLSNTNNSSARYSSNVINFSQWSVLQNAGAVFLSAAGSRHGDLPFDVGNYGNYWSASCYLGSSAYYVSFSDDGLNAGDWLTRYYGYSVRLVCPAE